MEDKKTNSKDRIEKIKSEIRTKVGATAILDAKDIQVKQPTVTAQEIKNDEPAVKVEAEATPQPEQPQNQSVPTEIATIEPSSAIEPAQIKNGQLQLTQRHLELIKTQIAKNATPEEFDLFVMMARKTRLDPLMRQLYFMKYRDRKASEKNGCRCGWNECTCGKTVYSPATYITSIDGYRIIAHRTGDFAGVDEPTYQYDDKNRMTGCTIKVYRKSSERPFAANADFAEYNTGKQMWEKMPKTMIAKVAEALALRKAFPNDLSGIYTQEEMDQATKTEAIPAKTVQMITKDQALRIKAILTRKGTIEQLKTFVAKQFGTDTMINLTSAQAEKVIETLNKLPDRQADPVIDDAEAIFGTKSYSKPQDIIDVNDIPDNLGEQQ